MESRILRIGIGILTSILLGVGIFVALTYARGNTITPDGIQSTGTIKLNVSPGGNFVAFLDEQRRSLSGSNTIDNVPAGEYTLRIQKEGYNDWQQNIVVRIGLVTDISAQLFPEEFDFEQVTRTNVDQVYFSPSRRYFYYTVSDNLIGANQGLWKQTLQQSNLPIISEQPLKITNLTEELRPPIESEQLNLLPSPDDNFLLVHDDKDYYLLNANNYNEPSQENVISFDYPVVNISWLNNTHLLIESNNMLVDYAVNTGVSRIIYYQDNAEIIYSSTNNGIVFVDSNQLMLYQGEQLRQIELENVAVPDNISEIYSSENNSNEHIIATNDSQLFFLDTANSLLANLGEGTLYNTSPSARSILFLEEPGKAKTLTSINIQVSIPRNTVEISRYPISLDPSALNNVHWAPNSNYFIFTRSQDNEISVITADKTGNNLETILELTDQTEIPRFAIPYDNSGLVIKLQNSITEAEPSNRANIYKLNFSGD